MSLKYKLLLIIWSVTTAISLVFIYLYDDLQENEYLNGIDNKLYTSALMARAVMSNTYHDNLLDKNSVSKEEYLKIIDRYNKICLKTGLQYLWSNLFLGDKVVFTSSTSTSKDVSKGDHALFFDVHSDPEAFAGVMKSKKTHYSTFTNEWGMGRMVLNPYYDKHGRMYVFGASISIDELNDKLYHIKLKSAFIFLIFFVIGTFASLYFSNMVIKPISTITNVAKNIADGKYGEHVENNSNSPELGILAHSINTMSDAILIHHNKLKTLLDAKTDKLHDSESYISQIVENMADGIISIDENGIIEKVNQVALKIFGYKEEELIGKNVSILLPDKTMHLHDEYIASPNIFLEKINNIARELSATRKNGEEFPLELNVSSIQTKSGIKYTGIMRDITERIKYQNILRKARDDANAANKAKSEFISSMSHELRTPLNAIIGFSQLLQMGNPSKEDINESSEEILQAGNHLLDLVNDILDLARIESDKIDYDFKSFSIGAIIKDCLKLLEVSANEKSVNITCQYNNLEETNILADKLRLKQVILNLLSNAIKYNRDNGSVTIILSSDSDNLIIKVIDTGPGISEEKQALLFQPFNRLGAENSNIPGTGIGLLITRQLIEKMNGEIGIESQMGKGSTFWISIPLSSDEEKVLSADQQTNDALKRSHNKIIDVLYVEDNISNQKMMDAMLKRIGNINVSLTGSAETALAMIKTKYPDIILLDIDLPGMDGYEFVEILKSDDNYRKIPIIAVSANAMLSDIQKANSYDFFAYLTKPVMFGELENIIDKCY